VSLALTACEAGKLFLAGLHPHEELGLAAEGRIREAQCLHAHGIETLMPRRVPGH
jgi:hypothetical protein